MSARPRPQYRSIKLLCQECHGDLVCTAETFHGAQLDLPVWICSKCKKPWVYTHHGWRQQDY